MRKDPLGFLHETIAPGVNLYLRPSRRFKRTQLAVFLEQHLEEESASAAALLARVLRRGTQTYPETLLLEQAQVELYGAALETGVLKIGERHLLSISFTFPAERYVDDRALYARAIPLLMETVASPARDPNGQLREVFVNHETSELIQRIRSLIEQKHAYARWKCIEAMCAEEPYGIYSLGTEARIRELDAARLTDYHARLVQSHPVSVYASGDFHPEEMRDLIRQHLPWQSDRKVDAGPVEDAPVSVPASPRRVEERQDMVQGWLVLGFRTGVVREDEGYHAMGVMNGLFGGTVHSRLFLNVREKASLAYSASSTYDAEKGILLAVAGIDPGKREQAETLILQQLEDLAAGRISDHELEATRAVIRTGLKERDDHPHRMILGHLTGRLGRRLESMQETEAALERVGPTEVAEAARQLRLDTVYFLGPKEPSPVSIS